MSGAGKFSDHLLVFMRHTAEIRRDHLPKTTESLADQGSPPFSFGAPGGTRFYRVKVPHPPGSVNDIAEDKGACREVES